MQADSLNPYDTGGVLQPHLYVQNTDQAGVLPFSSFGKVDFDDEGGATQCVVQILRIADGYLMLIEDFGNEETRMIHLPREAF